jgi:hypothetical protein
MSWGIKFGIRYLPTNLSVPPGKPLRCITGARQGQYKPPVRISTDGSHIAFVDENNFVYIHDTNTAELLIMQGLGPSETKITNFIFSLNNHKLAVKKDSDIHIYNIHNLEDNLMLHRPTDKHINIASLSSDGNQIICKLDDNCGEGYLHIWSTITGLLVRPLENTSWRSEL